MRKIFLLSPAHMGGVRADHLLNPNAAFALAVKLRREGLALAEAFTFASGLYFRGKIAYARQFAGEGRRAVVWIITTNAGLVAPEVRVRPADLRRFGDEDIHHENPRYCDPLREHAAALAARLEADGVAVLLGSIATAKYREVLLDTFGDRLVFPVDFIGRGDMSRGALLLHAAEADHELPYIPLRGARLNGPRAERWEATLGRLKRR